MLCKFLITIFCLFCSGSFGQWNWHGSEMGDNGQAGNDVIIPMGFDDSIKIQDSNERNQMEDDGMYPHEQMLRTKEYPKCSKHKYYAGLCKMSGYHSHKCPRTPCQYVTKEATTRIFDGTRVSVELAKKYYKVGAHCKENKECSKDCKCSTIWCKVPERKMTKIMGKYYRKMRVFIPYPCGCQCRQISMHGR